MFVGQHFKHWLSRAGARHHSLLHAAEYGLFVRSIYSPTDAAIGMLVRNDQSTEFDGRKASLNSARSTDVVVPSYLLILAQPFDEDSRECGGSMSDNVGIYVTSWVVKKIFINLYIYLIYPHHSIFEGWNIKLQKLCPEWLRCGLGNCERLS